MHMTVCCSWCRILLSVPPVKYEEPGPPPQMQPTHRSASCGGQKHTRYCRDNFRAAPSNPADDITNWNVEHLSGNRLPSAPNTNHEKCELCEL